MDCPLVEEHFFLLPALFINHRLHPTLAVHGPGAAIPTMNTFSRTAVFLFFFKQIKAHFKQLHLLFLILKISKFLGFLTSYCITVARADIFRSRSSYSI